jgi:hypothetical protein
MRERADSPAVSALVARGHRDNAARTDRGFAIVMIAQWIGGIVAAAALSPRTWEGGQSAVHPHGSSSAASSPRCRSGSRSRAPGSR